MACQRCHILIQWIVLKRLTLSHDVTRSIYILLKEGHVYAYFLLSKNGELKASTIYLLSYVRKDIMKGLIYINEELSQYENIISVWIFNFRFNVKPSLCINALLHSNLTRNGWSEQLYNVLVNNSRYTYNAMKTIDPYEIKITTMAWTWALRKKTAIYFNAFTLIISLHRTS